MNIRFQIWAAVALLLLSPGSFALAQSSEPAAVPAAEAAEALPDAPSAMLQQVTGGIPAPTQQETEAERRARIYAEAERDVQAQEKQRIAVVVPNFNTVISGRAVPLSKGQKTRLAVRATLDPFNVVGAFVLGGISEISGSHRGYGWGPEGYFKRVGANVADVVSGTMLAGAVYPILLRQDPRFFRRGSGGKAARVRHALAGAILCRGDSGGRQPNFSNVLGNFSGGLLSNLYYPASETGIRLSIVNSSIVTAEGALGNLALEFSPDVQQWWQRRRAKP